MLLLNAIIICFLLQPPAISDLLEIFNCKNIENEKYIVSSLDISCENHEYFTWRNKFYFPCLFFWIILYPSFCFLKILFKRKRLDLPEMKLFFGFFYIGFKQDYYYWEFFIMYRKILTIFVLLLPEHMNFAKGYVVLSINSLATYVQIRKLPFIELELNKLEIKANIGATLTVFCGLFFLMEVQDIYKAICFIFIIIINNLVLLNWLIFEFYLTYQAISKSYIFKRFCPNLPKKIVYILYGKILFLTNI